MRCHTVRGAEATVEAVTVAMAAMAVAWAGSEAMAVPAPMGARSVARCAHLDQDGAPVASEAGLALHQLRQVARRRLGHQTRLGRAGPLALPCLSSWSFGIPIPNQS